MRILHLSDIHYSKSKKARYEELFEKLTQFIKKQKSVDLILISGDFIDKFGDGDFNCSMNEICYIIMNLLISLGLDMPNIIVGMGNHEVDKEKYNFMVYRDIEEHIFESCHVSNDLVTKSLREYESTKTVSKGMEQLSTFFEYKKVAFQNDYIVYDSPILTVYKYDIDNKKIGIASLNNVWYSSALKKDVPIYGNSFMGIEQVQKAKEYLIDCDLKIATAHSSLSYLHEVERRMVENAIITNFDIYLSGHTHYTENMLKTKSNGTVEVACLFSSSTSFNVANYYEDSKKYSLGFNIYNINNTEVSIEHLVYSGSIQEFVSDTEVANDGVSKYQLNRETAEVTMDIREVFIEQKAFFDDTLITSIIDTVAPSRVESIFVEPTIFFTKKDVDGGVAKEKQIELNELYYNNDKVILLGTKECGKSTILYKIFTDILATSLETGIYPIFVNLKSANQSNDIEKHIAKELKNINYGKVKKFLNDKSIVLLIDNLNLKNEEMAKSIRDFISNNNVSNIVCTSELMMSGEIPIDVYKSSYTDFIVAKIKPMTMDKIESYSSTWFNTGLESSTSISRIIDFAKENNMPTYPIFMSMLLWLTESKKNIITFNNAMLIQNFIEKLLEKHNSSQYMYTEFNYLNKVNLLVGIAQHFEEEKATGIDENTLYDLILTHLKMHKFGKSFKAEEIKKDLMSSGIFTYYCEETICFRYTCIYNYFLAIGLMNDETKLMEVLNTDAIFYNVEVLDIVTTLKVDSDDIVLKIGEYLEQEILEYEKDEKFTLESIDDFYHTEVTIVSYINDEQFEEKQKTVIKEKERNKVDKQLIESEAHQSNVIKNRHQPVSKLAKFERLVILMSRALRNSDKFKGRDDVIDRLDDVITASIYFVYLYNIELLKQFIVKRNNGEVDGRLQLLAMSVLFSPFIIETYLQSNIGTIKLKENFQIYYEEYCKKEGGKYIRSEFKDFIVNFLLYENDSMDKISMKRYIRNIDEKFVVDNTYFKLLSLYYSNDDIESPYIELIREIKNKNANANQKLANDVSVKKIQTDKKKTIQQRIKRKDELLRD